MAESRSRGGELYHFIEARAGFTQGGLLVAVIEALKDDI